MPESSDEVHGRDVRIHMNGEKSYKIAEEIFSDEVK